MAVSDTPQSRTLTDLAEAAAAAGDYPSAARHLESLAALQESELGPTHPDLANTLNNLAVVAERAGDLQTAEAAFRRACVITRSRFDATHPSVTTTARNLREFCEAHGLRYDEPAPAVPSMVPSQPPTVPRRSWSRVVAVGVIAGLAAAVLLVWQTRGGQENPTPAVAAAPASAAVVERPIQPTSQPGSAPLPTSAPAVKPTPAPPSTPALPSGAVPVNVVTATVCREFSTAGVEWGCTPVTDATAAGALVFYTRIKASEPTSIEHRWYHGDTLVQRVMLRVSANTGAGYRTFSRNTVSLDRVGAWRVELRSPDGAVLSEQSFVVQ